MKTDQTYNGWTNYETWLTNLWLTNDPGYYEELVEAASQVRAGDTRLLADQIKSRVEDMFEEALNGPNSNLFAKDMLKAAKDAVNYDEIASNWLEI